MKEPSDSSSPDFSLLSFLHHPNYHRRLHHTCLFITKKSSFQHPTDNIKKYMHDYEILKLCQRHFLHLNAKRFFVEANVDSHVAAHIFINECFAFLCSVLKSSHEWENFIFSMSLTEDFKNWLNFAPLCLVKKSF